MKKRILSLLLALCMVVGLLPVIAMAEDAATDKPSVTFNYMVSGSSRSIVVNAGDDPLYWVTTNSNASKPDYYYMKDCKATDNWNVKLEYPADGIPTATLRDATFVEGDSWILQFAGSGAYNKTQTAFAGDVKVILEGTNTATFTSARPAIRFKTTGTATIAGPGSLTINHSLNSTTWGVIHSAGNLTFDNANVDITMPSAYYRTGNGIVADGGDITVKGGSLKLDAHNAYPSTVTIDGVKYTWSHYRPVAFTVLATKNAEDTAGGNMIIQDGANVEIFGSGSNSTIKHEDGTTFEQAANCVRLEDTLSISDSDVLFAASAGTYLPVFTAGKVPAVEMDFTTGYTVAHSTTKPGYNADTDSVNEPSNVATKTDIAEVTLAGLGYFKVTHGCIPGEPVYEGEDCSTIKDKVTYCTLCGKEVTREPGFTVTPDKAHTPGTPVENAALRKTVAHDATTDSYPAGYYVMETYCDVCGELIEAENVPFEAGLFYMPTYGNTGGIGETSTTKPQIILNPGETKYYTTNQAQASTDYPDSWYRATGSVDNWTIKLEYPVGGNPIMTLKGATIKNDAGIYYGIGKYICKAPLTIVVEEDSIIASRVEGLSTGKYNTYNRALTLRTTADVTITGPGKLTLSGDCHSELNAAVLLTYGNLTLDNANVEILTTPLVWPAFSAIHAKGADFTVKNSKLSIIGVDTLEDGSATAFTSIIKATTVDEKGGNVTIQDGSDVRVKAGTYSTNGIATDGQFTIKDSNVELALVGKVYTSLFTATSKPVLDFTKNYQVVASTGLAEYDAETGTITLPTSGMVDFATTTSGIYYFKVQMTDEIAGTAVTLGNTLDVNFAFEESIVGADGYVEFVKGNGEPVKVELKDCTVENGYYILTFPGVAAKEMGDTITVTVYDRYGNAVSNVYSDSIEAYALRMLRGEKPADHSDEQFEALKTLLVDMLNYGAAAQTHFGYNTGVLANAALTDPEKALATDAMEALTTEERAVTGEGYLGTSFVLESDIAMLIALNKAVAGEGGYALVTFTNHYGNVITQQRVEADNQYNTHTQFRFDGLVAADARYTVTWEVYTAEGTAPIVTVTDSLEKYVARSIDQYAWMEQIIIYSDSAYDYLHFNDVVA